MTSLITLFPIFSIIQDISVVYKLLKGQTKLVLLKGKKKRKIIQALFVMKISQLFICISLFTFSDFE